MTAPPYLDDLQTGEQLPALVYEVTQDLIDAYGLASLDLNPIHMDPDWAARAQVLGTPQTVAHGMMSMSYTASVVLRAYGALADIAAVDTKFTKPVPVGSTITVSASVRDIHLIGDGSDHAVIAVKATDEHGDTIAAGTVDVRLPRRPA